MKQTVRIATTALLAAVIAAVTAPVATANPAAPARPDFVLPAAEPFDAAAVPAYSGDHNAVYAHIDANLEQHLANIQRWLRQPSISALDIGVRDMAEMVRSDLEGMGFQETAIVETDGHPGVWGFYDAGAERTLMLYLMYDVQPVDEEDWQSPPFAANLVEHELGKVLMARGATNQKGPQRALLNAIESIIAVDGTLPVNLMITAEGEEELGSPHYPQIIDQYEDRLSTADGVIFPFNSQAPDGGASLNLGVKGILYFEAEASGGDWGGPRAAEIHGSYKAIVDSPVWRLVQGLSTLVSEDGNTILVPGYYDSVRPPTAEEASLIAGLLATHDDDRLKDTFKVGRWIDGMSGEEVLRNLIYTPTLNIDGLYGGYTGEGVKTILPHMATAKLDSRLPVGLDPDEAFGRIRAHLDAKGYEDIVLRKLSSYPASQTSVHTPLVQAVIGVFNKHGATPTVNPRLAGSAPFYQFTERLGLPMVPTGFGFGTGAHAPNEFMLIEPAPGVGAAGLAAIEKAYVDMLYALAAPDRGE
ncbi:M20/M25/M40 family metallo-hydrolase [Haliea sp. E1-2-M8]|uniref:M20/M25/M40 family metallo-hydrolase n=1 Tax=Haliea sp. E1-2-M8 TaxID=3064706 RepID=UPI00271D1706|nr:M20/M25/M40 family metallo-hydrolase [Haliea sp. E1-2-M8]MDO8862735.1 M20/M25/M40 family metallo-hydrolase [Haliea sp. E1-2-M8]